MRVRLKNEITWTNQKLENLVLVMGYSSIFIFSQYGVSERDFFFRETLYSSFSNPLSCKQTENSRKFLIPKEENRSQIRLGDFAEVICQVLLSHHIPCYYQTEKGNCVIFFYIYGSKLSMDHFPWTWQSPHSGMISGTVVRYSPIQL